MPSSTWLAAALTTVRWRLAAEAMRLRLLISLRSRTGDAPGYNPLAAVAKFIGIVRNYGIKRIVLDGYAGSTFKHAFEQHGGRREARLAAYEPARSRFRW